MPGSSDYEMDGIHLAAHENDLEEVKRCIASGVNPNLAENTREGCTPLIYAAECGHLEMVKYLIEDAKVDVNKMTRGRFSKHCLTEAVQRNKMHIVEYLLENGHCKVQWSPDLTNRSGPGQLFVKSGYSLNPKFL